MGVNYEELLGNNVGEETKDNVIDKPKFTTAKSLVSRELPSSFIPTNEEFSTGQNIRFGESQFDSGIENLELAHNINKVRAERQPWYHQATHALGKGIIGGLATAGETISYILDVPGHIDMFQNYFKEEDEFQNIEDNVFAEKLKEFKEDTLQDWMPIYRKNPDKLIDFNDSGFYWDALGSVIDSAVGFGITGMGAGAAAKLVGRGLRLARLQAYNSQMANGLTRLGGNLGKSLESGIAGRASAAYLTNFGESKMMGLELYENSQKELLDGFLEQYKEENDGAEPDDTTLKEFKLEAKIQAGKNANNFMWNNKMFMLTDYLQLNTLFKGTQSLTRNLLKQPASTKIARVGQFLKTQLKNGPKESFEEIGQNVLQMEGIQQTRQGLKDAGYNLPESELDDMTLGERILEFATSEQALLEGAMGFLGGPIQYSITQMPFESTSSNRKQYASQQGQIGKNEEFVKNSLYNIVTNEALSEAAEEYFPEDAAKGSKEVLNTMAFDRIAMMNFAKGTTKSFEDSITSFIEDENNSQEVREGAQKQLERLQELETKYQEYSKKYAEPTLLLQLESKDKVLQDFSKKLSQEENQLEASLREHVELFNQVSDSSYTLKQFIESSEDISNVFKQHMSGVSNDLENYKGYQAEKKEIAKLQIQNNIDKSSIKNKRNNAILNDFKNFYEDINNAKDNTIEEGRRLAKSADGFVKETINRRLDALETQLNNARKNDVAEENGGQEQDEFKSKKKQKESLLATDDSDVDAQALAQIQQSLTETKPSVKETLEIATAAQEEDYDIGSKVLASLNDPDISIDDINTVLARQVQSAKLAGKISEEQADEALAEITKSLTQQFNEGTLEDTEDNNFKFNVALKNKSDAEQDSLLEQDSPKEGQINGVKTLFTNTSKEFDEFLESNEDKSGLPVQYRIGNANKKAQQNAIDKFKAGERLTSTQRDIIPIEVVINNRGKEVTTALFPVNTKQGDAATAERELRDQILKTLSEGKTPQGKIQYQYSGAILSDGVEKNIRQIQEVKDKEDIDFMYTDENGRLVNVDEDRTFSTEFTNIVTTKDNLWSGIIFTTITDANGNKKPLKLNARKLNEDEIKAVTNILIAALNRDATNPLLNTLENSPGIANLLEPSDLEFLGMKATLGDVLNFLVYEGEQTQDSNPQTRLFVKNGKLYMGDRVLSLAQINQSPDEVNNIKKFLYNFKRRNISVNRLVDEPKYKEHLISQSIINTDVAIKPDGTVFQRDKNTDTSNPDNRYKTKAIYVSTKLDNEVEVTKKETTPKESVKKTTQEVKDRVEKTAPKKGKSLLGNIKSQAEKTKPQESDITKARHTAENQVEEGKCNQNNN